MNKALVGIFTGLLAISAHATYINFIDIANTLGEGPISSYTQGGLTLTLSATKNGNTASPYLDYGMPASTNGAGIGVCGKLFSASAAKDANECNPGTDDNIQVGEYLYLSFNQNVKVTDLWFNNNHEGGLSSYSKILVNGIAKGSVNSSGFGGKGAGNVSDDYSLAAGQTLALGYSNTQYYLNAMSVEAVVPEPTTIGLFGLGLGCLGFFVRRRNKATI